MNGEKIGNLLKALRLEKQLTQKNVAEAMGLSDKTISKWERGLGCPDVSLLTQLSSILGVTIETLLQGDLHYNPTNGGQMRHIQFYQCMTCGNMMTTTNPAELFCCSRKLEALQALQEDAGMISVSDIENDYHITVQHEMTKANHLTFAAYVTNDRVLLIKLYPEQDPQFRVPKLFGGTLYIGNTQQQLWMKRLHRKSL